VAEYRVGRHWGVTIVHEGNPDPNPKCHGEYHGADGGACGVCGWDSHALSRHDSQLVAVVVNGDTALAERICALLNADDRCWHGPDCPGSGPECERDAPLKGGHRDCAAAWHANHGCATEPFDLLPPADSCTCVYRPNGGPDPACIVHQGRRARGPKPPNPPGCICDGSGRTCPRRGAVT